MRQIVPFEALNQILACLRYVNADIRPFSILEVAEGTFIARNASHFVGGSSS